jgi:prolyl oligopeptidase PreP (S9A serine peptidase family)
MFETRCVKIKLKPGSIDRVREWAQIINTRSDEALETLRDEGVVVESAFLDRTEQGDFLIYYVKAKSFERMEEVVQKSSHPIDAYHRQVMQEIRVERSGLELLIDLDRISEV